jgi:hypothetical protein
MVADEPDTCGAETPSIPLFVTVTVANIAAGLPLTVPESPTGAGGLDVAKAPKSIVVRLS